MQINANEREVKSQLTPANEILQHFTMQIRWKLITRPENVQNFDVENHLINAIFNQNNLKALIKLSFSLSSLPTL